MSEPAPVFVLPTDGLTDQNWLTWYALEHICELLRKHKRVEIRCDAAAGPYVSNLVAELTAIKEKKTDGAV